MTNINSSRFNGLSSTKALGITIPAAGEKAVMTLKTKRSKQVCSVCVFLVWLNCNACVCSLLYYFTALLAVFLSSPSALLFRTRCDVDSRGTPRRSRPRPTATVPTLRRPRLRDTQKLRRAAAPGNRRPGSARAANWICVELLDSPSKSVFVCCVISINDFSSLLHAAHQRVQAEKGRASLLFRRQRQTRLF